jgi:DNA-binding FadR family transcriptional regulator
MSIARSSRLYAQVATDVAARIADGTYPVGKRLPSERELASVFQVSRPSIREALIALEVDGLVEVRMGSGVYVISQVPRGGKAAMRGVGPFELLEARRAIEGETSALAAARASDEDIAQLELLLTEMVNAGDDHDRAEVADQEFHILIASMTGNSPMQTTVESLWEARRHSPQYQLLSKKAHVAGIGPSTDEHRMVLEALRSRDPDRAREAMRSHLTRVLSQLLKATETHEEEQFRAKAAERRKKFLQPTVT